MPADASSPPQRLLHYGRDITGARWTDDDRVEYTVDRPSRGSIDPQQSRRYARTHGAAATRAAAGEGGAGAGGDQAGGRPLSSPDGRGWRRRSTSRPRRKPEFPSTDFERRHEERFKGAIFDWKDFQRDGQPFPAPNLRARPAAQ